MRGLIILIAKDLNLLWRDRLALSLLVLAPIVVISAAGFSLSTLYSPAKRLLPVSDLDRGDIASQLVERLKENPALEVVSVPVEEAKQLVGETPEAGAALVIPEGFTDRVARGEEARLVLWTDPVKHLEVIEIGAAVERARGAIAAARIAARISVVQVLTHAGDADFEALAEDSTKLAEKLLSRSIALDERSLFGGATRFNAFDQNVPGFGVTFVLLGTLFGVGLGLLDERDWGTLHRLRASPLPHSSVLLGKVAARWLVGVAQLAILFAFGSWAFDISLGPSLPLLGLVIVGVAFAASAFGLLAAGLAKSRDAVLPLGTIAIVGMAAIGGCWWPITIEPMWIQKLAHLFPTAWAMEAFNDLMLRGRGFTDVWPALAALFGFGAVYTVVGARLYAFNERGA